MDSVSEAPTSFVLIEVNGAVVSKDKPMTGSDLKVDPIGETAEIGF